MRLPTECSKCGNPTDIQIEMHYVYTRCSTCNYEVERCTCAPTTIVRIAQALENITSAINHIQNR